jgi:uncharacterized membrane protein YraQ (UPF0718 family)
LTLKQLRKQVIFSMRYIHEIPSSEGEMPLSKTIHLLNKPTGQIVLIGLYLLVLFALVIAANVFFPERYTTFATVLLSIVIEASPFLLAGSLVSGCIHVFLDQRRLFRIVPRHPVLGALLGATLGLLFPVCECGVIPVTRRLYQKGLPISTGVAFMLAAPVVNPIVIASTYAAFGWGPMLFGRLGGSFLIASTIGLLFAIAKPQEAMCEAHIHAHDHEKAAEPCVCQLMPTSPLKDRIAETIATAGDDFLDMLRYLIAGAIVAAGLQTLIPQTTLLTFRTNTVTSVLTMMLLAFVLSVCSTADAFLALAFTTTFTQASVLAFLVFGPMVDIKSTLMLLRVFRRRSVMYLILLAAMLTLTLTVLLNVQFGW